MIHQGNTVKRVVHEGNEVQRIMEGGKGWRKA